MTEPTIKWVESPGLVECQLNAKDVYDALLAVRDKACRGYGVILPGELTQLMQSLGLICPKEHFFSGREAKLAEPNDCPF